jgi:hypothetical protein
MFGFVGEEGAIERKNLLKNNMLYYSLVAHTKFARHMNNFFLVFQYVVFRKTEFREF